MTRKIIDCTEKGESIVGFVDSAKRTWSMSAYVDMLTRTATMKMYNEAKKNEFVAHREDLVIVSSHGGGCDLCKPFDGKILSLTGATEGYTTLDEAEA